MTLGRNRHINEIRKSPDTHNLISFKGTESGLKKKKTFCIGVYSFKNVVIVSGEQRRDSTIHIHVSILPQTPLPSRLPHNTEQSSMCYTVSPCWLSILNSNVYLSEISIIKLIALEQVSTICQTNEAVCLKILHQKRYFKYL